MCFSHIYKNIFKNKNIFSDIDRSNSQSENLRLQIAAVPPWSAPKKLEWDKYFSDFSDRLNSRRGGPNLRLEITEVPAWSTPKKCSGTNISQDIETGNITLSFSRYIVLL